MFKREGKKFNIKETGNARDVALFVFLEITENSRKSNTILKETFEEAEKFGYGLTKTDRAFITKIVIGTLGRLITIDAILSEFLKKPLKLQKPIVRAVLRISAYQLLYMNKVPHSAACNEAVRLIKMHGLDGLSGFVNGVLRALTRKIEEDGLKAIQPGAEHQKYSLPKWMYSLFESDYGKDKAGQIAEALLFERHDTIRLNLSKVKKDCGTYLKADNGAEGAAAEVSGDAAAEKAIIESLAEEGFILKKTDLLEILRENQISEADMPKGRLPVLYSLLSGGDVSKSLAFKKGYVTVQDPSSALVGAYADAKGGDTVIDLCAAPGGKALCIAELSGDGAKIDARDVSSQKVRLIEDNVKRCGYKNIKTRIMDALEQDEDSLYRADIVIADLPCSGLGVIAKKPDIKLNLKEYSIEELKLLQRDILRVASNYIKPKGRLIYSTCTVSRAENEQNADWIAEELGFRLKTKIQLLPGMNNDGFFIAVLEKRFK